MESLRQMAIRDGSLPKKIENVILASPDIDVDVFARQWSEMGDKRPNFTIFVSQDDRALALSRYISGDVQRLGQINPAEEPYKTKLESAGITVVDLTKVKSADRLNHGKFAESPEIVQLIGQRLVTGQTLTDPISASATVYGAVLREPPTTLARSPPRPCPPPSPYWSPARPQPRRPGSTRSCKANRRLTSSGLSPAMPA